MTPEDRLKYYVGLVDINRKWVSVMDTKASFISVLNLALITFIWTSAKLTDGSYASKLTAIMASTIVLVSLFYALRVVLPRITLKSVYRQPINYATEYKPISFFGWIANNYSHENSNQLLKDIDEMDTDDFAKEAIEQHLIICHIVNIKTQFVAIAGWSWLVALIFVIVSMVFKF